MIFVRFRWPYSRNFSTKFRDCSCTVSKVEVRKPCFSEICRVTVKSRSRSSICEMFSLPFGGYLSIFYLHYRDMVRKLAWQTDRRVNGQTEKAKPVKTMSRSPCKGRHKYGVLFLFLTEIHVRIFRVILHKVYEKAEEYIILTQ